MTVIVVISKIGLDYIMSITIALFFPLELTLINYASAFTNNILSWVNNGELGTPIAFQVRC